MIFITLHINLAYLEILSKLFIFNVRKNNMIWLRIFLKILCDSLFFIEKWYWSFI